MAAQRIKAEEIEVHKSISHYRYIPALLNHFWAILSILLILMDE